MRGSVRDRHRTVQFVEQGADRLRPFGVHRNADLQQAGHDWTRVARFPDARSGPDQLRSSWMREKKPLLSPWASSPMASASSLNSSF